MKFRLEFRGTLEDIFSELSMTIGKGTITSKSAGAADIISLGDTWVNFAISKKLIEPIKQVDDQDWFHGLSDKWKVRYILFIVSYFFQPVCSNVGLKVKCDIIFNIKFMLVSPILSENLFPEPLVLPFWS